MTGPAYPCSDLSAYGVAGCLYEEGGFIVFGHGPRALAALNRIGIDEFGHGWRRPWQHHRPEITVGWAVFHETCGHTEQEHEAGHPDDDSDECDCEYWGLPPCDDQFAWRSEISPTERPGWLPVIAATW